MSPSTDSQERARIAALPILDFPTDVAILTNVPGSTLEKLYAEGRGPRVFKIGRRRKTTPEFLREWRDQMAAAEAA